MKTLIAIIFVFLLSIYTLSQSFFYSFENTHSGWDTTGIDLEVGGTTIPWSVHPSNEVAIDSSFSMQYYLENYTDAGKIWIQKSFSVEQHKDYRVTIDYKLATKDFGMANLWTIITGVHLSPPTTAQELMYQGHTGNGYDFDTGYIWLGKNYEFVINSDTSNNLWIAIGVWGTWEGPRTYYLDSLAIHLQEDDPNNIPDDGSTVRDYHLYQNYPNPFNPGTVIRYEIPTCPQSPPFQGGEAKQGWFVHLTVYDVLGNEVAVLVNEKKPAGTYEINFNSENLLSGIYFYRLETGNFSLTRKMVLLK